jgi:hypothetical protein
MEPAGRNHWKILLNGAPTELVIARIYEDHWVVSKTSGEIIARNCRSATEAQGVAAQYLYLYG